MPRFTQIEYQNYLARQQRTPALACRKSTESTGERGQLEHELQAQIVDHCANQKWICFRGSMAHRTYRIPGEPDLIIVADEGRIYFVEVKVGGRKLTPVQRAIKFQMQLLGHNVHIVRSLNGFLRMLAGEEDLNE
jgi:hypothetical protein